MELATTSLEILLGGWGGIHLMPLAQPPNTPWNRSWGTANAPPGFGKLSPGRVAAAFQSVPFPLMGLSS